MGGGGDGGLAALKEDPRGFIQKCKTKFGAIRALRTAYPGSRINNKTRNESAIKNPSALQI